MVTRNSDSARSRAYEEALRVISNLAIDQDEFLREDVLAQSVGVSRTPVREAFLRLEAEGLIRLVPKKGAYVATMSAREIRELLECRELFESRGAEALVGSGHNQTVAALRDNLRAQATELDLRTSQSRLFDLDRAFHGLIVAGARNDLIDTAYDSLRNRELRLMLTVIAEAGQERWAQAVQEHQRILDYIEAGDQDGARRAVREHCARTAAAAVWGSQRQADEGNAASVADTTDRLDGA